MARLPMLLRNGSATSRGVLGSRNSVLVSRIYDNISTTCRTCFVGQSRRGTVYFYQACSQRQLSSSSALTNKDRNDGEFFTATQTFDSEYSSSGVDASVTDVLAQTEDFAALGLGGYSPSGLLQSLLEFLHVNAHLPWWASIAAATITLRLLLFPLALHMRRDAAKMANISPITSKINERIVAYRRIGNNLAVAEEWKKQQSIFNQHGVNPSRTFMMSFAQLPVFVSFLMAIRGMANLPLESMKTGGLYWFTDLTVPDPTYTLPLMACLAFISNIEVILIIYSLVPWPTPQQYFITRRKMGLRTRLNVMYVAGNFWGIQCLRIGQWSLKILLFNFRGWVQSCHYMRAHLYLISPI